MIRKYFFMSIVIGLIAAIYPHPSHAYTMADYWAFNEGNVWIYDRGFSVMGTETHNFDNYTGRELLENREFCNDHPYFYTGTEGVLLVGFYSFEGNEWINISTNPVKLSDAEMSIGDSVSTNIPSGVISDGSVSVAVTVEAVETITVPAGKFNNAIRLKIFVDTEDSTYTEKIWLAEGVGPVQIHRVSETNDTPGCLFSCGSFTCCDDILEERFTKLKSFIAGKSGPTPPTATLYVSPDGECNSNEPCFSVIQDAIDYTLIKVTGGTYDESLIMDEPKNLAIQGGWDSKFTTQKSNTIIKSMSISNGTVSVEDLVIR